MKIAVASDHGGLNLKNYIIKYLKEKNIETVDFGTNDLNSCDYPIFANKVSNAVLNDGFERGILVCGTGVGMAIAANRFKGIRAVNASDTYSAKMSRLHNNSNILTLGERVVGFDLALDIVEIWLKTDFEAGRHLKRIDMIDNM